MTHHLFLQVPDDTRSTWPFLNCVSSRAAPPAQCRPCQHETGFLRPSTGKKSRDEFPTVPPLCPAGEWHFQVEHLWLRYISTVAFWLKGKLGKGRQGGVPVIGEGAYHEQKVPHERPNMPAYDQPRINLGASRKAKATIKRADADCPTLLLSQQAFEAFAEHIESPPQPMEALRQLMARDPPDTH